MIQIKHVTLVHRTDLHVLTDDVQCVLHPGDKAVIIGEEGNGKSTLLKWIYNPKLVESYIEAEGERILGNEICAYLPQELSEEDGKKTVYEYMSDNAEFFDQTPKTLAKLSADFGMNHDIFFSDQKMYCFSGGERVKLQLMRCMMHEPSVLLLDEPSNDIDLETLHFLEQFILKFSGIVLFISHDEEFIRRTANMVIHLEQIRRKTMSRYSVVHDTYDQYLRNRAAVQDKQMQDALNERKEKLKRDEKLKRIEQRVEHEQNVISRQNAHGGALLKKKMHTVKAMEHRFEREAGEVTERPETEAEIFFLLQSDDQRIPNGKNILNLDIPLLTTQDGSRVLAEEIHLNVRGPEKVCIIGKNGAGKSTLLKQIREQLQQREDIKAAYMPQNYEELLDPEISPVEYLVPSGEKAEISKIRTWLGSMKYTADEMDHPIRDLSGGQKAKILFLKMSLDKVNVLILDEPTRNFSPLSGPVIRRELKQFPGAIISVSHDRRYIREVCDRVFELTENGLCEITLFKENW